MSLHKKFKTNSKVINIKKITWGENRVKLLDVNIDGRLNFYLYKSRWKLHSFSRATTYMDISKRRILLKSFITSIFILSINTDVPQKKDSENRINTKNKQETLRVVTIAMTCSSLASLWKFQFLGGLYITKSNIYDGAFIAKIFVKYIHKKSPS